MKKNPFAGSALPTLACAGVLFAAACGDNLPRSKNPPPRGMEPAEFALYEVSASQNMNCPREQLSYERSAAGRHFFVGCNDRIEIMKVDNGADQDPRSEPFTIVPSPAYFLSKKRKCPIEAFVLAPADQGAYRVAGCGAEEFFRYKCIEDACAWRN
jgi:hypothetical protein